MIHHVGVMHKIIDPDHFDQRGSTSIPLCRFHRVILGGFK